MMSLRHSTFHGTIDKLIFGVQIAQLCWHASLFLWNTAFVDEKMKKKQTNKTPAIMQLDFVIHVYTNEYTESTIVSDIVVK